MITLTAAGAEWKCLPLISHQPSSDLMTKRFGKPCLVVSERVAFVKETWRAYWRSIRTQSG
jgi:hypothetical protein